MDENLCVSCGAVIPEGQQVCQKCASVKKETVMVKNTYCGLNHEGMNKVLDTMCSIEDRLELNDEENDAFDIAIQCISTIMNLMLEDDPIIGD